MKKILIGIITYIVFLLIYFLQANFFSWFTIAGVSPNLFIMLILFLGLFSGGTFSMIMGLIIRNNIRFCSWKNNRNICFYVMFGRGTCWIHR